MEILDDENLEGNATRQIVLPTKAARLSALLLDVCLIGIAFVNLKLVFPLLFYNDWFCVFMVLLLPIYKILLEGMMGATLGKKIMGIIVVNDDEKYTPIGLQQANKRFAFIWPMYAFPLIMVGMNFLYVKWTGAEVIGNFAKQLEIMFVLFAVISVISHLWNERQQTWYDRWTDTICIREVIKP